MEQYEEDDGGVKASSTTTVPPQQSQDASNEAQTPSTAAQHEEHSVQTAVSEKQEQSSGSQNETQYLKRLANYWKGFDMKAKQEELNKYASEFLDQARSHADTKKQLSQEIARIRQISSPEQQAAEWPQLVQRLQQEIDTQAKRAKYAEKTFSKVLRDFTVAPDPSEGLKRAVSLKKRTAKLEQELQEAQSDARAFEEELSKLQNQDVTIRDLESRVEELVNNMDEHVRERVEQREQELQREHNSEIRQLQSTCNDLRSRLNETHNTMQEYQQQIEQSESKLFDIRARNDEELSSKQKEIDMLSEELEQLRSQNEHLRQENENLRNQEGGAARSSVDKMRAQITALQNELERERSSNQQTSKQFSRDKEKYQSTIEQKDAEIGKLKHQIDDLEREKEQLKSHLDSRPSLEHYQHIQSELDSVKRQLASGYTGESQSGSPEKPVSTLVEERIQKLQGQLANEQTERVKVNERLEGKENEVADLQKEISNLQALNAKLEQHVEATTTGNQPEQGGSQKGDTYTKDSAEDQLREVLREDQKSTRNVKDSEMDNSWPGGKTSHGFQSREAALLHVLKEQRERFRKRAEDAETSLEKLRSLSQHDQDYIKKLENECARLKHQISTNSAAVGAGQPHGTGPSAMFVRGEGARAARMNAMISAARQTGATLLPAFSGDYRFTSLYATGQGCFARCKRFFSGGLRTESDGDVEAGGGNDTSPSRGWKLDNLSERIAIQLSTGLHSSRCVRNTAFLYIVSVHVLLILCFYTF
eukprot:gb/GECG01003301.1/.p1 GENE.gb/GECG01003301.1/~~gb/GECG01003301.1/.p1  ORF type:complete len:763 (+),score=155.52 gb/GECG01003301.1/:1-2289(+)